MTVDITQDEMNILNLNGLSIEDVKSDIDYMRSTGLDDNTIRQQYTDTINELRPITKQSVNDTRNIKTWNEKGGIGPFEYASKKAMLYNGTYDNIDNNANFNAVENALNNSSRNSTVDEKLQERQNKIDARNQRVNEGTASFFDRAGAAIDRIGNSSFQNQVNAPDDFSVKMSGVNKTSNIDKSKKIGFKESLGNSFIGGEWIPYIGGYISGSGDKKEREIQQHILNGEPIREDELNYLNHRIQERQEEAVRGYTFGGKVADGFLPSMIRYSLEVATGTWFLKSLGLMPELGAGAGVGEQALYHLGNIAKGGTANALLPTGWNDTYENYQQRLLENGMEFTDKGETIFKDANEKPAISFLKSLGSTFAAFASEYSGGLIGMPIKGIGAAGEKYIASPMFKYLKAQPKVAKFIDDVLPELSKAYEKFNFLKPEGKNYEFLKDMTRFDGFLEEMGEEAVEDVLNLTLGTGDDKRTIENYAKAIFKTPDEWAIIAGAIALQGGTLSVASHTLGNYMKQNGATDDEIIDVMKNLSENDKEKAVEDLIKNGEINLDTTSEQRIEQSIDNLTTTLLDTGKYSNRDQAEKVARLGVNMLGSIADKTGIDIEDLINEDMPNIEQDNKETFIDDKGVVHSGITYNEQEQTIDNRYNELINEISNLPDDYSDEDHINKMVSEVDLLEKIQSGENLSIDDMELANDLIEDYENNGNKQFANQLREKLDNANTDFDNSVADQHFQRAITAGATTKDEKLNAIKEWKEKGTDSKYFKKWFGDSKVVDESGEPLEVYHGTESDEAFSAFETNSPDGTPAIYFSSNKKVANSYSVNLPIFEVYLKMENPLEIDAQGKEYNDFTAEMRSNIDYANRNGYDGVIVKNIRDGWSQGGKIATTYVVFNPEQIKSVNNQGTFDENNPNIYFQRATNDNNNIVDLTNDFEKAPSIDEVKAYINEIVENGTKFATLSPNWFVDIKKESSNKKQKRITDKLLNKANFLKLNKPADNRHKKYVMSLEKLLANAEYAGEKENTKKDKKPNIEKYHYFKTDVKIGNKIYQLIFDTEEYKNDNKKSTSVGYAKRNLNETEVDTNIINDNVKNFKDDTENDKSSSEYSANTRGLELSKEDTNSINDNAEKINPKTVHLYNIKEIKNPQLYQKQHKMFIDNNRAEEISNRLVQVKGSFIPAENLVKLFKDADESTIVHEFAHWWLEKLVKHSEGNEELQEDLKEIRKFVKNNGEEFTDEQHERFARGFEVYIRTGSAKTNRLKKLFEDFKNALLSLYDSIKSLGFEDTEISEINNLFDRLLTTEKQRIQAAVFDRCNTIQSQIEEIRTNQENELSEIDEIEKNNLERSLQDNRKKQQVEEYLRLADKVSSRVPKSVKEYSKRFRQVCYEILSAALNHKYSIKYLQMTLAQNNVKAENLRQELMEVDDDVTTLGGMQSNWYEFFGDTGVNYNNDEVDGDAKLVEQALDRIENNNFAPPESYPGEEIIGKFMGAFDYLSGKVLSLRGENKDAAFEALSELFSGRKFGNLISLNQLPQDVMTEISNRMDEISKTYIEQKTNEKNKYAIPNVSLSTQLRTYVTHKLHNTKSYDPIEKKYIRLSSVNRLFSLLPLVNNSLTAKEVVRTINAHAIKQLENRQKYILHKEIQKQIKINSKLIKVGALKQGKFDWKTNTVFSELQQMNHLTKEDARKEYLRLIDADTAVIGEERDNINQDATNDIKAPTDFQGILKVKFLEYKSNNAKDLNLSATRSLLEDILQLKFEGRRAKNEQDLKKALTRYDYKNNLIEIMDKHRDNNIAKYLARWTAGDTIFTSEGTLANWESLLTGIFDKATAEKYSLLKSEADVEVYAHRKSLEFYKKAMDIYHLNRNTDGLKNKIRNVWDRALDFDNIQPLVDLFRKYDETTYPFKQATWNKDTGEFVETTIELNHSQLITLYAWSLNPNLKERLITQFVGEDVPNGAEKLNELMFSKLSEQDKLFAWAMVDTCDTMYEDTNEVFIRTTGLSLPRVDNYIPSKTERIGSDLDMMHETMLRSTNPSFIKQRKNCSRIKMEPISPLEIILPHINKTARYVVMSEKVNFFNRIFQSPDIKAKIIEIYGKKSGEKIHRILLNQLATSTYDNYAKSITVGKNLIDTVASNYITSKIGGNLKVMFSQLTSMVNYCENMPFGMWSKGLADALAHPKKTVDFMFKNCEYLQARLAGNSQNEIISMVTNNSDKFRALRNFCTSNTKYGDIIAIMFGGKPYVDYLISKGMSQEEAFTKFTEDTLRSQQSGHNSATSAWQKKQAQNAITRMIFAFNNTNFQYERKFVDAMANFAKGDISKEEFMKSFLVYKVFNPILFTSFLSDLSLLILFQNMFGGGDDDPLASFVSNIINAIFLSNWKAYGFLGIIANSIVSAISAKVTGGMYFEEKLPLISDFETSINKLLKGKKLELGDYIEMVAGAGDYSTGVATTRLYNATGGLGDITQGDIGTGLLRIIGYGKYRASLGATGKPPEKKKK